MFAVITLLQYEHLTKHMKLQNAAATFAKDTSHSAPISNPLVARAGMCLYTARFLSPFNALKCQQSYFQENPEMEKKSRLKHYTKPDCQDEPQGNIVKSEYWHSPSSMIKGTKQNETKKMSPNESILTIKY